MTAPLTGLNAPDGKMTSPYTSLDRAKKQFRLLRLLPGAGRASIQCTLRVVGFQETVAFGHTAQLPDYETISYCWGDGSLRELIEINQIGVSVPRSSAAALRRMRLASECRLLWIDAVCIDQDDVSERGHQVGMMRDIYANGRVNLIHLEAGEDVDTKRAKSAIMAICDDPKVQRILKSYHAMLAKDRPLANLSNYDKMALISLMSNSWFTRVWVVQEAVLAKENLVFFGSTVMDLHAIVRAAAALAVGLRDRESELLSYCTNVMDLYALTDRGRKLQPHIIASILQERSATQPQDKIYGLLGLVPEASIVPNYDRTPVEVYLEATRWMIGAEKSLQVFTYVQRDTMSSSLDNETTLPSWVPDWNRPRSLSNDPSHQLSFSDCSGKSQPRPISSENAGNPLGRVLSAYGFRVGIVRSVGSLESTLFERLDEAVVWDFTMIESKRSSLREAEEAIAMTFCAGMNDDADPINADEAWSGFQAYSNCYRSIIVDPQQDEHEECEKRNHDFVACRRAARSYEPLLRRACHARRFFCVEVTYCGLGPRWMLPGDVAVILYGLDLPAVLRPAGDRWQFLGLAYIHGVMDGELVDERRNSYREKDELFEIT